MAASWRLKQRPRLIFISVSVVLVLLLLGHAVRLRQQDERHRRDLLDSTEVPAEHIDPAAIDLTPLVNALINSSQSGSRQLFSLLSVTSYSSLALHKLTLLVYNISSISGLESSAFRRRFCYCITNETNDLTDFTAILLDVMGNSTSYLHELFKSSSILSVSQKNNSDCIYICVMAGKTGKEVPDLWEVSSITPLFNQTIVEGPHRVTNISSFRLPVEWHQLPMNLSHIPPSVVSSMLTSRVHSTAHASSATLQEPAASTAKVTTSPHSAPHLWQSHSTASWVGTTHRPTTQRTHSRTHGGQEDYRTCELENYNSQQANGNRETRGCPWRRPELPGESVSGSTTTVGAHKLQPCVLELCKFFSQCLCRPISHKTRMKRFCDDSHLWYEKHTSEVCQRVRRVSFSRNLKQRCLTKMCNKL
ncbi:uncharacterized protein hhla1 [Parambassis ranga]|uniref:Uncharacterized protein hhla1 n=1 Tax=Parambassis ranga TaxID=210632 RepID=A0A6P7K2F8_9TELE|nr:HERV-H LTR-associating protein 1 [Parambassis ranga]